MNHENGGNSIWLIHIIIYLNKASVLITIVVMDVNAVPYVGHDGVEPTACLINITFNACYMFN